MSARKVVSAVCAVLTSVGGALLVCAVVLVPSSTALADYAEDCTDANCNVDCTIRDFTMCQQQWACKKNIAICVQCYCTNVNGFCHCMP